jgi:hypothetical protein
MPACGFIPTVSDLFFHIVNDGSRLFSLQKEALALREHISGMRVVASVAAGHGKIPPLKADWCGRCQVVGGR